MKRIICAALSDQENHEGSFNIVLGSCAFQYGILAMLASGCVFADTAKLGVLVLDEVTCKPIEGAKVRGGNGGDHRGAEATGRGGAGEGRRCGCRSEAKWHTGVL